MVSDQIYGLLGSIQDCLFLYTGTCGTTKNVFYTVIVNLLSIALYILLREPFSLYSVVWLRNNTLAIGSGAIPRQTTL
jgi:hypothetical protein